MSNPFLWPGTKILRSTGNAFDWRSEKSNLQDHIISSKRIEAGRAAAKARAEIGIARGEAYYITPREKPAQKSFTTYSKATRSPFKGEA